MEQSKKKKVESRRQRRRNYTDKKATRRREESRRVSEEQQEPNTRQHFCCILIRALPALESKTLGAPWIEAPQSGNCRQKGLSCSYQIYTRSPLCEIKTA